jgi:hypothetical protein
LLRSHPWPQGLEKDGEETSLEHSQYCCFRGSLHSYAPDPAFLPWAQLKKGLFKTLIRLTSWIPSELRERPTAKLHVRKGVAGVQERARWPRYRTSVEPGVQKTTERWSRGQRPNE